MKTILIVIFASDFLLKVQAVGELKPKPITWLTVWVAFVIDGLLIGGIVKYL